MLAIVEPLLQHDAGRRGDRRVRRRLLAEHAAVDLRARVVVDVVVRHARAEPARGVRAGGDRLRLERLGRPGRRHLGRARRRAGSARAAARSTTVAIGCVGCRPIRRVPRYWSYDAASTSTWRRWSSCGRADERPGRLGRRRIVPVGPMTRSRQVIRRADAVVVTVGRTSSGASAGNVVGDPVDRQGRGARRARAARRRWPCSR